MKKSILYLIALVSTLSIQAHDFVTTVRGERLYFSITDSARHEAVVTYPGHAVNAASPKTIKGSVEIPVSVTVGETVYRIVGIGPKAFSHATELTHITMPGGLAEIGNYAFENCTSLKSIVFPGNTVRMGEDPFRHCDSIRTISLGSDWTGVNLKLFQSSSCLASLAIPAKMRSIQNLKALHSLETLTVDASNPYYQSSDGVLYSKDGKTLFGVPHAFQGDLKVLEGVTTITRGAMADCVGITSVDLPASVEHLWFGEFGRLTQMTNLTLRHEAPFNTALSNGNPVVLFQIAKCDITIRVPKKSLKLWKENILCADGAYAPIPLNDTETNTAPMNVLAVEMAGAKNFKGDKSLSPKK